MKTTLLVVCMAAAIMLQANAQTVSPGANNSSGNNTRNGNSPDNPSGSLPPGLQNRNQLPPGLQNRSTLPPGLAGRSNSVTESTNVSPGSPNQFTTGSNQINASFSNQFGFDTNQSGGMLTPTSTRTNSQGGSDLNVSNNVSAAFQDQAFTAGDQKILTQIRQVVTRDLGAAAGGATTIPCYFIVRNGVVQLVGTVPTVIERQRVELIVRRIPGVTQVLDRLQVNSQANSGVNATTRTGAGATAGAFSSTNMLTPTGAISNGVDRVIANVTNQTGFETNLPPTSRTNGMNPGSSMPPGLEKRDQLPPGLQNRNELPPGLAGRTNSSGSNP